MEIARELAGAGYPARSGRVCTTSTRRGCRTAARSSGLLRDAVDALPAERLWVNPDCGLKTRRDAEVIPALSNLVEAARRYRSETPDDSEQSRR